MTRKGTPFLWGPEQDLSFDLLKTKLRNYPVIRPPNWDQEFHVNIDASDCGIGTVLAQMDDKGKEYTLCFDSKTLSVIERRYSSSKKKRGISKFFSI